ncbi:MAG: DNA polymerase I [Pirellulales bacterium]
MAERCRGKTVYVIDAHSLIFQVFHALPEMTSPKGEPVGAVFGFARDVLYLIEQKRPDYLICAFDLPGPTFRHELYDQYKVHREEMPESLRPQIPAIQRMLEALRVPLVSYPGHEADDCLATLAEQISQAGGRCVLVTGDKDCRQLINDRVSIYNIRKNELLDAAGVEADWGIRPDQVVDYQALVGDSVDNVPGVPLIGPKMASQLLQQYGSLQGIYDHLHELKAGKRRDNLQQFAVQAWLSRDLAYLRRDLPLSTAWLNSRPGDFDRQRSAELFREWGFRSLTDKMAVGNGGGRPSRRANAGGTDSGGTDASGTDAGGTDAATTSEPVQRGAYELIADWDRFESFCQELSAQPKFAIDTETTDVRARWARLVGLSFAWESGVGYYVPVLGPAGQPVLEVDRVLARLRPILTDPQRGKIGQNLKYDWIVLCNHGVRMEGLEFDTMVASYLLEAGQRSHGMDELARRYLQYTPIPITDLIGTGRDQRRMDEVDVQRVCEYAAEDADVSWRLYEVLADELAGADLSRLFHELEMPLVSILAEMEQTGIAVDAERLRELSVDFQQQMDRLQESIYRLAGHPFNVNSPRQLAEVLFQELKLPVVKKTKTGPSTDADVLEELAPLHPLAEEILEHRQYAKLKGTYVDALPLMIHPETGRVHTSLNQVVTATGRLSSNDPNLQNIPVRTEAGRRIRSAFHAGGPDQWLLCADYSQIELRVLAHFSQDQALVEAFAEDRDIHASVAAEVHGVGLDEVTSDMRRRAKGVNFGIIYGQSPFGLAKALGIEQDAAGEFIEAYFQRYPGVLNFMETLLADCSQKGYVTTVFGRRREIRGVRPPTQRSSSRQRTLPERTAINTVIQGSAADLIKLAMIQVRRRLDREAVPARMLLQIHDELVFEAPADALNALAILVESEMTQVAQLAVPLKVEIKVGHDWAHCDPWLVR